MATNSPQRSVLLIGKSQLVLDDAIAGLRDLGHNAEATNDFTDVTTRFDLNEIDRSCLADRSRRTAGRSCGKRSARSTPRSSSSRDWPASQG